MKNMHEHEIDREFSSALRHHEIKPSSKVWLRLVRHLPFIDGITVLPWYYSARNVAAVVLILSLFSFGGGYYLADYLDTDATALAVEQSNVANASVVNNDKAEAGSSIAAENAKTANTYTAGETMANANAGAESENQAQQAVATDRLTETSTYNPENGNTLAFVYGGDEKEVDQPTQDNGQPFNDVSKELHPATKVDLASGLSKGLFTTSLDGINGLFLTSTLSNLPTENTVALNDKVLEENESSTKSTTLPWLAVSAGVSLQTWQNQQNKNTSTDFALGSESTQLAHQQYGAGLHISAVFAKHFTLESGLGIRNWQLANQQRVLQVITIPNGSGSGVINTAYWYNQYQQMNLQMLQVPMLIGYQAQWKKWSLHLQAGKRLSIVNQTSGLSFQDFDSEDVEDQLNTIDYSGPTNLWNTEFQVGLGYQVLPKVQMLVQPGYQYAANGWNLGQNQVEINNFFTNFKLQVQLF